MNSLRIIILVIAKSVDSKYNTDVRSLSSNEDVNFFAQLEYWGRTRCLNVKEIEASFG